MGCIISMAIAQQFTKDEKGNKVVTPEYRAWMEGQLRGHVATLDRVAYAGPGCLLLKGQGGFFNPAPPINTAWLAGRLSPEEFSDIVRRMNAGAMDVSVLLPPTFSPSDIPRRSERVFTEGSMKAVAEINSQFAERGISLTLDRGQNETTVTGVRSNGAASTRHVQHSTLYITIAGVA